MFAMLAAYRKRRAIASYRRRLPRLLARSYGPGKTYTPQQVKQAIRQNGLSDTYSCYAMSMFTEREPFDHYHAEIGERCDYGAMRDEAAGHFGIESDSSAAIDWSDAGSDGGGDGGSDGGGDGGSDSGGGSSSSE